MNDHSYWTNNLIEKCLGKKTNRTNLKWKIILLRTLDVWKKEINRLLMNVTYVCAHLYSPTVVNVGSCLGGETQSGFSSQPPTDTMLRWKHLCKNKWIIFSQENRIHDNLNPWGIQWLTVHISWKVDLNQYWSLKLKNEKFWLKF